MSSHIEDSTIDIDDTIPSELSSLNQYIKNIEQTCNDGYPVNLETKNMNNNEASDSSIEFNERKTEKLVSWGDENSSNLVEIGEALDYDRKENSYVRRNKPTSSFGFCSPLQIKMFITIVSILVLMLIILLIVIFTVIF